MQASPSGPAAMRDSSRTRVGSPSALNTRAMRSASSTLTEGVSGGTQHEGASIVVGRVTNPLCHVLTIFDRYVTVVVLKIFDLRRV